MAARPECFSDLVTLSGNRHRPIWEGTTEIREKRQAVRFLSAYQDINRRTFYLLTESGRQAVLEIVQSVRVDDELRERLWTDTSVSRSATASIVSNAAVRVSGLWAARAHDRILADWPGMPNAMKFDTEVCMRDGTPDASIIGCTPRNLHVHRAWRSKLEQDSVARLLYLAVLLEAPCELGDNRVRMQVLRAMGRVRNVTEAHLHLGTSLRAIQGDARRRRPLISEEIPDGFRERVLKRAGPLVRAHLAGKGFEDLRTIALATRSVFDPRPFPEHYHLGRMYDPDYSLVMSGEVVP